jgi:RimJ/RimL family protein N-acetyltransferase
MSIIKETVLTGGAIILRPYRLSDVDNLYEAARESLAELMPWMPWAHQDYSKKETRDWIRRKPDDWKNGIAYDFAILDARDGTFLGGCGLNRIDYENRMANLGYWVRTSRAGQGVAPTAARLLAGFGFKELSLNRIEILVATGNERSQQVAVKTGAQREGILRNRVSVRGRVQDGIMYSLIPGELAGI